MPPPPPPDFLTRPLGALFFGRMGDKYGRRTALIWSIYLMSIPTMLVGCLPTYSSVREGGGPVHVRCMQACALHVVGWR